MIRTIQADMKSTVRAMEEGTVQVQDGVQSTVQAGDSLREIIHTAEQVGEMVTHIATAGTQQSATSEHVKERMQQIAMLVNQAATEAWNSAQACQGLSELAADLQKMVANFQLRSDDGPNITVHCPRTAIRKGNAAIQPNQTNTPLRQLQTELQSLESPTTLNAPKISVDELTFSVIDSSARSMLFS